MELSDNIMAERGFDFEYDLLANVPLNITPFSKGQPQISLKEKVCNHKFAIPPTEVTKLFMQYFNWIRFQQNFGLSVAF